LTFNKSNFTEKEKKKEREREREKGGKNKAERGKK
jgi:hypothetical protein